MKDWTKVLTPLGYTFVGRLKSGIGEAHPPLLFTDGRGAVIVNAHDEVLEGGPALLAEAKRSLQDDPRITEFHVVTPTGDDIIYRRYRGEDVEDMSYASWLKLTRSALERTGFTIHGVDSVSRPRNMA